MSFGNPDFVDPANDEPRFHCAGCEKESDETFEEWGNSPIQYHNWSRNDCNSFFTGIYCDACYNDETKYPYRKDNYNADAIANGEDIWGDE
jgi:hypothetical protein